MSIARAGGMVKNPETTGFAADYQKKYQRTPEVFTASYYDAMMLIAQAMKEAQATSGPKLQLALQKIKYKCVAGSYAFDQQRDLLESPVTVFHFVDGIRYRSAPSKRHLPKRYCVVGPI